MTRKRKLTPRQTAVLAALERRGQTTIWDLREGDFPGLAPSTIGRVLDRLVEDGLVRASGDPAKRFVGGVRYWAASREPKAEDLELDTLVARLRSPDRIAWADYERGVISVLVPLNDILEDLIGSSAGFRGLSDAIISLIDDDRIAAVTAGSDVTVNDGVEAIRIELGVRFEDTGEPFDETDRFPPTG